MLGSLACLLLAILGGPDSLATASSTAPGPLARVHTLDGPVVRRLPKRSLVKGVSKRDSLWSPHEPVGSPDQLLHSDTLLLRFVVDQQPISLVVRPNEDLLHPDARVHYHSLDPVTGKSTVRTEALRADDIRAYEGHVVREQELTRWWNEEQAGVLRPIEEVQRRTRGWARIVLPSGDAEGSWEGAFEVDGQLHTLMGVSTYERTRHPLDPDTPAHALVRRYKPGAGTVVVRNSDVRDEEGPVSGCGHDALDFNTDPLMNPVLLPQSSGQSAFGLAQLDYFAHRKRQAGGDVIGGSNYSSNFVDHIGSTTGCPKNRLVAFIGLAADCTYVARYGSQSAARTQLLTNINSVSALYQQTYNVSIGAVELNVQDTTCPTTTDPSLPWNVACPETSSTSGLDLNDRLSAFSRWRGQKGGGDGAGLWHLLTNCATGSEVGVAWLGQLCRVTATQGNGGWTSGTGVTASTRSEWQVMAHEIGHNFGAVHDCVGGCSLNGQCCPLSSSSCDSSSSFIMAPVSLKNTTAFSPCTIGNVCSLMQSTTNTSCLVTPGQRATISLQQCGNGIVDPGEQCDPGSNGSACCTSDCKFASGAVCDPTNSACCTSSCQLQAANVTCRPVADPRCDVAEVCSGSSPDCPSDGHISDGTSCGSNGLACAAGVCTSRDLQCQQSGSSLNISAACSLNTDSSCSLTCANPQSSNACIVLDSNFIDGTPCGYAGTCSNGQCQTGAFLDAAKSWYTRNLQISIPVTVIAGLLVLAILGGCLRCLFARRRRRTTAPSAAYYNQSSRQPRNSFVPSGTSSQDAFVPPMSMAPAPPASVLARNEAPAPSMRTKRSANHSGSGSSRQSTGPYALPYSPPASLRPASMAGAPPYTPPQRYSGSVSRPYE